MKMTITNGSINTCSTYQRSSVSPLIVRRSEQHVVDRVPEHRRVTHHVRADGDRPERQLVPRQQVAGEREQQGERQQDDADHPVELARRLVGAVVEDARHVQEDREHHEVRGPSVHISHERSERDRGLEVLHVRVGVGDRRPVEEHQEDAGDGQQDEQEERQAAEAQRVGDLHRVPLHLHRVKVVQHVVHDHVGTVTGAVGVALAEDRAGPEDRVPRLRAPRLVTDGRDAFGDLRPVAVPVPLPFPLATVACLRSEADAVGVAVSVGSFVRVARLPTGR